MFTLGKRDIAIGAIVGGIVTVLIMMSGGLVFSAVIAVRVAILAVLIALVLGFLWHKAKWRLFGKL